MHELQHPTRCIRYCGTDTFTVTSSRIDAYKFSFLPRTVTDWNAYPASTRAKQSTDAFKKALHIFPDTPADRC